MNEPPEYLQLTKASILENAPIGSTVGQLLSRDPDVGSSQLVFAIKSPANSPFRIGGTGHDSLVTRQLLDYESMKQTDILINVTDSGRLSLEKYFTIKILGRFFAVLLIFIFICFIFIE